MSTLSKANYQFSGFLCKACFLRQIIFFVICTFCFVISCSKDDDPSPGNIRARLCIKVSHEMIINESVIALKSTINTQDFRVSIYKASGELVQSYDKASELPPEIQLDPGEYYISAHSNNSSKAAFSNPCFAGKTENISLNANDFKTITVNCTLANCAVTIKYSDYIRENFSDYYTEVGIGSDKLVYEKDEIRFGYFDLQPISIKATLIYTLPNGSEYTKLLSGVISNPDQGKLYEIELNTGINEGYCVINIILDESVEKQSIKIDDQTSDLILYGDILITEIMYDPVALSDSDGEWFEVYNNSIKNINLKDMVISTSSASHVIASELILSPGEYYVLARKNDAFEGVKYIYGTGINLTNSSGTVTIATYGTDGTDGIEIASVSYDSSFPKATGASLNLNPLKYNVDLAKSGSSWCLGNVAYNTGDLGTPGLPNNICE